MKGGKTPLGYTIVEVMIVLAVSGLMFLMAANFISGRQARTAFTQGTGEMGSRLQDVIEQVSDGRYSDIQLSCPSCASCTLSGVSGDTQGTNTNCVFLGKLLHFTGGFPTNPTSTYDLLSITGDRVNGSQQEITDLATSDPGIVDPLTSSQTVPQSLDVTNIVIDGGPTTTTALGFFQSQGTTSGAGTLTSSGQRVTLYYATPFTAGNLKNGLAAAKSADICVQDGPRRADINLGSNNGSSLSVNVTMRPTTACP